MDTKELSRNVTVMALGGAGCRFLRNVAADPMNRNLHMLAVDTDQSSLELTGLPPEKRLLAGACWRNGRGCGGNPIDGQRALAHERGRLEKLLTGCDFLLVIGGLGGGTASGGASVILSVARKLEIPVMFLVTQPFSLEGHSRRRVAEEAIRNDLLGVADAVLCLPNDLLFSVLDPNTALAEAFALADQEVSRTVIALTAVLVHGNLLSTDFSAFTAILKRRKSYCSIGVGVCDGAVPAEGRAIAAMSLLLESPLLGGGDKLADADAVIFSLLGGPSLSLGETKQMLELAGARLRPEAQVLIGASTCADWGERIQLCAVTIRFDGESELPDNERKPASRNHRVVREPIETGDLFQPVLPMEVVTRGIMEKTTAVIWNGEDLDIPTFKRRSAAIDNGKLVGE